MASNNLSGVGDYSLSNIYNSSYWNNTAVVQTTPTVWSTGTIGSYKVQPDWSEPTMTKAKQDPLDWLKSRVDAYVELGTLHD